MDPTSLLVGVAAAGLGAYDYQAIQALASRVLVLEADSKKYKRDIRALTVRTASLEADVTGLLAALASVTPDSGFDAEQAAGTVSTSAPHTTAVTAVSSTETIDHAGTYLVAWSAEVAANSGDTATVTVTIGGAVIASAVTTETTGTAMSGIAKVTAAVGSLAVLVQVASSDATAAATITRARVIGTFFLSA